MTQRLSLDDIFEEARRRFESFAVREGKSLDVAWVGLGTPYKYSRAVKAGLMRPLGDRTNPRVLNWWLLTEAGLANYRERFPRSEEGEHKYKDGLPIATN